MPSLFFSKMTDDIAEEDYQELRRISMPGFYYNPKQSYEDYQTAYLNALLLLGITQTPEDVKVHRRDSHPIQAFLRNAYKFGYMLKMYKDMKSICVSPGVIMCKINHVWHAFDAKNRIFVDSLCGSIKYNRVSNIVLIYKFVKV